MMQIDEDAKVAQSVLQIHSHRPTLAATMLRTVCSTSAPQLDRAGAVGRMQRFSTPFLRYPLVLDAHFTSHLTPAGAAAPLALKRRDIKDPRARLAALQRSGGIVLESRRALTRRVGAADSGSGV